jgi:hypothetical protein
VARIASAAHGVVTRRQLLRAGLTVAEIRHRVRTGALLGEYPGVYRVGHRAASLEARYLAAVLACGNGALLSGRAAAYLLGLLRGPAPSPEVSARGDDFRRYTYGDVFESPRLMLAELRSVLSTRRPVSVSHSDP